MALVICPSIVFAPFTPMLLFQIRTPSHLDVSGVGLSLGGRVVEVDGAAVEVGYHNVVERAARAAPQKDPRGIGLIVAGLAAAEEGQLYMVGFEAGVAA